MKIRGFKMKPKAGFVAEYKRRHDEIWLELATLLRNDGFSGDARWYDDRCRSNARSHEGFAGLA